MDQFKKYLEDKNGKYRTKALTAKSYKNVDKYRNKQCFLITNNYIKRLYRLCRI